MYTFHDIENNIKNVQLSRKAVFVALSLQFDGTDKSHESSFAKSKLCVIARLVQNTVGACLYPKIS